jgi:hypothetical protein
MVRCLPLPRDRIVARQRPRGRSGSCERLPGAGHEIGSRRRRDGLGMLGCPREDHLLLPLWVTVGAAEDDAGACVYHEDDFMGFMSVSSFRFGDGSEGRQRHQAT